MQTKLSYLPLRIRVILTEEIFTDITRASVDPSMDDGYDLTGFEI